MADKEAKKGGASRPRNMVTVFCREGDTADTASARVLTRPAVQAAVVIQQFQGDNHEVNCLITELEAQAAKVRAGDMGRAEEMLLAHAQVLDEVFCSLMRRAQTNMSNGYGDACERYMRLALKAQSQARTTLETLAEIKNPRPVAFVRQANIAHGPQQVNNESAPVPSCEKLENKSNELLPARPKKPSPAGHYNRQSSRDIP